MTHGYNLKRFSALILLTICFSATGVFAQSVIAHFDVEGAEDNPDFLSDQINHSDITVNDLVRGPGISPDTFWDEADHLYGANNWTTAPERDENDFFEFSVTPDPGFEITYDELAYGFFLEYDPEFVGPDRWDVCFSTDGFATSTCETKTITIPPTPQAPSLYQESFTTDLSVLDTTDQTVTFRFYAYNRTGTEVESFAGFGNGEDGQQVSPGVSASEWRGTGADVTLTGTVAGAPLPVELVRFEAFSDRNDVVLVWSTATETNNAGFDVQHQTATGWQSAGFVDGMGNSSTPEEYTFRVADVGTGTHAFRLRQVNLDGTYQFSPQVEIEVELAGTHELSAMYPNPFNPQTQFSLVVRHSQEVHVGVYDLLGRAVATLHEGQLEAGKQHVFQIQASGWTSGTYVVRVAGEGFSDTRRVVLLK